MTPSSEFKTPSHPPVEVDEMAFAIALFVAAANGNVTPTKRRTVKDSLIGSKDDSSDYLLLGAEAILRTEDDRRSDEEIPLARAVAVIWAHYECDARRQAICSRLVAFYSLMLRTRGALLGPWIEEADNEPQSVILAPAIVEAVATASIGESGQFGDADFRSLVQSLAGREGADAVLLRRNASSKQAPKNAAPLPISEVVQQLSLHLFAFQACVTGMHGSGNPIHFCVIERLSVQVATIGGGGSLQIMLSRAVLATVPAFPWLEAATVSKLGTIDGIEQIHHPHEVTRCELAILGSFIELLRSFVGDSVTLQILRNLWPLANLI